MLACSLPRLKGRSLLPYCYPEPGMPRRKLTAISVEKLRPPSTGRVEHFDTVLPGFAVRISASGVKSWVVFYRHQGHQTRMTLGRYPVLSLAEAREEARRALQQVAAGLDPVAERRKLDTPAANTFASVASEFIEKYAKPRNKRWRETVRILERDVFPAWGDREINTINRRFVAKLPPTGKISSLSKRLN